MQRPDNEKPIGTIIIDIYEGNRTFNSFKGYVPASVLMGIRVTLPRDYYTHLAALSAANIEKVAEDKRIARARAVEEERKELATKQAVEKMELVKQQKIQEAEAELKVIKHTVITEFTQVELRKHDQVLKQAEEKIAKLK